MKKKPLLLVVLWALAAWAAPETQWALDQSTLSYHVSHPLHQFDGVSHEARGKGICQGGQCEFLIAVPVKSFDSGDSNRDLHMLQVTRGAEFPLVTVRTRLPESELVSGTVHVDLEIQFAGQTATFKQIPFQTGDAGQPGASLRNHSQYAFRLQDRSSHPADDPHQERNPGPH